jgi:hypothetical protein
MATRILNTESIFVEWLNEAKDAYGADTNFSIEFNTITLDSEKFKKEQMIVSDSVSRHYENTRYTGD